jgi:hypothetical protein
MTSREHEPAPDDRAAQESDDRGRDESEGDDAYERAQPDSKPTVSSEPEPDDDPANAG